MSFAGAAFLLTMCTAIQEQSRNSAQLESRAREMKKYAEKKGFSTRYCFLLDMRMHSGLKRFFVYDLAKNSIAFSGLVAHGSCDQPSATAVRFSDAPGCGCTSLGIYKVGRSYKGQYGKAYTLYGLQKSNANAFSRSVVLHGYTCVPDKEIFPKPLCNSLGCPMVSYTFLNRLAPIIEESEKPVLLWLYNE